MKLDTLPNKKLFYWEAKTFSKKRKRSLTRLFLQTFLSTKEGQAPSFLGEALPTCEHQEETVTAGPSNWQVVLLLPPL